MSYVRPGLTFEVKSFGEGFSDTPEEDSLAPGGTRDARNALLINVQTQDGVRAILRKRNGCELLNPIAIATGKAIDGMFRFERENGDDEMVVACNGALYVWDGATTFTAITGGTGFTAGNKVSFLAFKNNLFVMDGTKQLRYDGTQCFPVGNVAPVNPLALGGGGGPGVTGTYEGFWVGYDPAIDHETSPSPTTAPVVFPNVKRQWTLPAHTLPANYTFWRVYCRRTDTNENNFFRTAEVAIGTAAVTEFVSDAARRDIGPAPSSNDQPPVFALAEEFKGYRLGVPLNSSDLYVSKILDPESQHPKDKFPIGGKGDSKPVRSVRKFGKECYARKPTRTYALVGDRVPFTIDPVDGSLGGVSWKSGIEVDGWWYDWDQDRGPYRTNFSAWDVLGDTTLVNLLATVNRSALELIEVEHFKTLNLILWAIPTGATTRKRTILPFNYKLGRWLAPQTGFEWSSLTQFTTTSGDYGVYFGDEWGRVYKLYSGEVDGVPSGTTIATIDVAATSGLVECSGAAFYTGGSGLAGMPAMVLSPSGLQQWVRIQSNTATVLTFDTTNGPSLAPVPSLGNSFVIVGGIDWFWWTPRFTGGDPMTAKSAGYFYLQGATSAFSTAINVDVRFNRELGIAASYRFYFTPTGLVWGSGSWGEPFGTSGQRSTVKHRIPRAYFDASFRFSNFYPNEPVEISYFRATADWLPRRKARSG